VAVGTRLAARVKAMVVPRIERVERDIIDLDKEIKDYR
jgi:uncharacterized protein (UPF0335 family)